MAGDIIGLGLNIVEIANAIRDTVDEVKGFSDRSKRLAERIESLLPAVNLLKDSVVAQEVETWQRDEPVKIKVFHQALVELERCVTSIRDFHDSLKKKDFIHKVFSKDSISGQFDAFSERLDILQNNIQFGITVELRSEMISNENAKREVKRQTEAFQRESKKAFRNRQEVDEKDKVEDAKRLLTMLQDIKDIKEDEKEQGEKLNEITEQLKELKIAVVSKPEGCEVDQVKTIRSNELKEMKKLPIEGSLGVVYKAQYMMEDVAVKRIQPTLQANLKELNKELRTEAENMKKFDSKHVVRLWGIVTEEDGDPMIVFEYMNKGTLRQFLDHMKANNLVDFPWNRRIHMALGGALGLYRIHNMKPKPMLHCAIGSDKFLVNSNWDVKICDVGFAKTRSSAGRNKKRNLSTVYFAPEHLLSNKQKYDERSEIYGYGVVMLEIATCDMPFQGMDPSQQAMFIMERKKEPLPSDCPRDFADIIDRCRSHDRLERPLTEEIVEMLQKCVGFDE